MVALSFKGRMSTTFVGLFLYLLKGARGKEREASPLRIHLTPDRRRSWACITIIAHELVSLTYSRAHVFAAKEFGACQVLRQREG